MKRFIFGLAILLSVFVLRADYVGASTSNFTISNFKSDFYLNKDGEGRSILKTVESITADFPAIDQNHGIERVIPLKYDGHSTSLQIQSIKDDSGVDINYSTSIQNDNLVLQIGSSEIYMHGKVNYVITYTQRDVTKYFKDVDSDEFYWDVNGTGWSQPFDSVSSTVHIGDDLLSALTGNQSCYYGVLSSTSVCNIARDNDVINTTPISLDSGGNITIAVGFRAATFKPYKLSLIEQIEKYILVIEIVIVVICLVVLSLLKAFKDKSAPGRGTIIAEYLPPKKIDIAVSSIIDGDTSTWAAATFVDLAVKHKIQVMDNGEEKASKKVYTLKLLSVEGLSDIEKLVAEALFGDTLVIGGEYEIKPGSDLSLTSKLRTIYSSVYKQVNSDGYYINNKRVHITMALISLVILVQSILVFIVFMEFDSGPVVLCIGFFAFLLGIFIIKIKKPFSKKGCELADYLNGLKLYIKIAEADRIKVLQSPQGVSRQPVDASDTREVLRLYERVLPYAILFGLEADWADVLGKYYEQQNVTPDWYVGSSIFNAAVFSSAVSSFSTSAAASSTYSSSSSGGSSGGGFSGGGGGGGGGGGW